MNGLMHLKELIKGLDYEWVQGKNCDISDIVIDSRKARVGSMFICTVGKNVDSHQYIGVAAAAGASAAIVQTPQDAYPAGMAVVQVGSARKAMSVIASNYNYNPSSSFNLIGVTGTNGKTSVTYYIESILHEFSHKVGLIGTVDIRVGANKIAAQNPTSTTPDPIPLQGVFARMKDERVNDVIMEVSSHALALDKLEGVKYQVGVFTNLTRDHLDFHVTMENYAAAKSKLFRMCKYGVANVDDMYFDRIAAGATCEMITYGICGECDYKAEGIRYLDDGVAFTVDICGERADFFIPVKGKFTVYNALAAIVTAYAMNVPTEVIRKGLSRVKGVPGRVQSVPNDSGKNVIVDYAHTPDGLANIISSVRKHTKGRLVTIFGCGGDRDRTKRPLMGKIAGELSDYCIITSDNPRGENPDDIIAEAEAGIKDTSCGYERITDRRAAIYRGVGILAKGDSLIIAGKGHENYQELSDRTIEFDDVKIAKEALDGIC